MMHYLILFLALGLFYFSEKKITDSQAYSSPNVIFILADDLGYGDLGFLGQQYIETPNIDRLAVEGMVFTNHYSGATVCAPSRSAFMTGLHTGHTPIRGNSEVQPEGQYPMPDTLMTISKIFKQAGYVTGAFGKWGLGMNKTTGDPLNQGFGEFYGYLCQRYAHRYYPAYLWQNGIQVNLLGNDWMNKVTYAPDLIQQESLAFIEKNKNKPFFLFMPIVTPHAELAAPDDELLQKYRKKFGDEKPHVAPPGGDYGPDMKIPGYQSEPYPHAAFAAMVERIDRYVGEVVSKLEELGLSENTMIVFTSDNGAHQEGGADPDFFDSNGPFRGYKRDLYEGGIHVPLVIKWPGKVKPNSSSDHISAFWDWLPTFAELLGQKSPERIDGISLLPSLLGKGIQAQHETFYWEFHELGGRQALRKGDWKLVKYQVKDSTKTSIELFNLKNDPGELQDLAQQNPEKVKELEALMAQSRTSNPVFNLLGK